MHLANSSAPAFPHSLIRHSDANDGHAGALRIADAMAEALRRSMPLKEHKKNIFGKAVYMGVR